MDRKHANVALVALLCGAWLAAGSAAAAEESQRVTAKDEAVVKDGKIDHNDEEETQPESVESLAEGKIRIISKTFLPPTQAWRFKEFEQPLPNGKKTHVDIWDNPEALGVERVEGKDTSTEVKIRGVFPAPKNAGNFPLRGEGNLQPPPGAGGAPKEQHWAAKILDFKLLILFQNAKMKAAGLPPKVIAFPEYQEIGVLVNDTVDFSAKTEPGLGLSGDAYAWSGTKNGVGTSISIKLGTAGTHPETITVLGSAVTADTVAMVIPPPNQAQWARGNILDAIRVRRLAGEATAWANANQRILGGGIHNGKADAARHAYWNAIMSLDLSAAVAAAASTAHERTGIEAGGPHNETVMDQTNNAAGRNIAGGLPGGATRAQVKAAVINALSAGTLRYLDDLRNRAERGLLQPTNK